MNAKQKQGKQSSKPGAARLLELLIPLGGALAVMLPVAPRFALEVNDNSGVYLYAGWRILQGDLPYLQLWDHKPPLIFYINALGAALTPGSQWGIWALELLALTLAAYLGYKLIKAQFGSLAAGLSTVLWLMALFFIFLGGNQTRLDPSAAVWGAVPLYAGGSSREAGTRLFPHWAVGRAGFPD